jgi:hypothetical protein
MASPNTGKESLPLAGAVKSDLSQYPIEVLKAVLEILKHAKKWSDRQK